MTPAKPLKPCSSTGNNVVGRTINTVLVGLLLLAASAAVASHERLQNGQLRLLDRVSCVEARLQGLSEKVDLLLKVDKS